MACTDAGSPCGATDCDATTGACDYPAATVACGSVLASCTDGTQQNPSLCDGNGGCNSSPDTVACAPFACAPMPQQPVSWPVTESTATTPAFPASPLQQNGTVSCISGTGFLLQASASGGAPSLILDSSTVENTELGVYASAGTATITNTTLQYNYNGAEQDSTKTAAGTISLGGGNTVVCSNSIESEFGGELPGVGVLNTTTQALDATNTAWDTPGPDVFQCDPTLTTCTCQSGSCVADAGSDGMDAVDESTGDGGTITTTGNTLSTADCTVPAQVTCGPNESCPPGEFCCVALDTCVPPGNNCL